MAVRLQAAAQAGRRAAVGALLAAAAVVIALADPAVAGTAASLSALESDASGRAAVQAADASQVIAPVAQDAPEADHRESPLSGLDSGLRDAAREVVQFVLLMVIMPLAAFGIVAVFNRRDQFISDTSYMAAVTGADLVAVALIYVVFHFL